MHLLHSPNNSHTSFRRFSSNLLDVDIYCDKDGQILFSNIPGYPNLILTNSFRYAVLVCANIVNIASPKNHTKSALPMFAYHVLT